jgi:hypothetical protein
LEGYVRLATGAPQISDAAHAIVTVYNNIAHLEIRL